MTKKKEKENTTPNITNKQFQRLKRKLQNIERVNNDRLYLIPCSGGKGWYEMAENSALIYYYEVIQKNGLKFRFFADTMSLYDRYELGYVRIPNINDVRAWLKKMELYRDDDRLSDGTWCFELNKRYTEGQMERFRQMELKRREELLTVSPAHNLAPEFYQLLLSIGPRLHAICNGQMDHLTRERIGGKVVDLVDEVLEYYHHLTFFKSKETARIMEKWKAIRADLYSLLAKIKVLNDYGLIERRASVGICEVVRRLIEISESKLKRGTTNGKSEEARAGAESVQKASASANKTAGS